MDWVHMRDDKEVLYYDDSTVQHDKKCLMNGGRLVLLYQGRGD